MRGQILIKSLTERERYSVYFLYALSEQGYQERYSGYVIIIINIK